MTNEAYSFWEETYGDYTPNAPLNGDHQADIVIIGSGYTGLTAAREIRIDNPGRGSWCWKRDMLDLAHRTETVDLTRRSLALNPELSK